MKRRIRMLAYASATVALMCLPLASHAEDPPARSVIISEVAWAGSSLSNADEWLELTNLSNDAIDLSRWTITGAAASSATLTLPDGSTILPHSTFLISNYDQTNTKSTLAVGVQYVTSAVSLSNSGLHLILQDDDGAVRDAGGDGGAPSSGNVGGADAGGDGAGGFASMARISPMVDGTQMEAWTTATSSSGFDEGATQLGTPGEVEEWFVLVEELEVAPNEPTDETHSTDESHGTNTGETTEPTPELPATSPEPLMSYPIGTLVINEVFPAPTEGQSEWIEIANPYNNVIPLDGWTVEDASGKASNLPDQLLGMDQIVVVENPSGKLNNDGDTVSLVDPNGVTIDLVEYGDDEVAAPPKGDAIARDEEGAWNVTIEPTKKEPNVIVGIPEKPKGVAKKTENVKTEKLEIEEKTAERLEEKIEDVTIRSPTTLRLSEIYANTTGNDLDEEFIELENTGEEVVSLHGWKLTDASGKIFKPTDAFVVPPHGFLTLARATTNIALNNSNETLELAASDGSIIDNIDYEKAPKGEALARIHGVWSWTTDLTPDEPNRVPEPVDPEPDESGPTVEPASSICDNAPAKSSGGSASAVYDVTLDEAHDLEDKTNVHVTAVVIAEPGVLGSQILYVADDDSGMQIYKHDGDFPSLSLGDVVELTGTISTSRGEKRIKIGSGDTIEVLGTADRPEPAESAIKDVSDEQVGSLVAVTGMVLKRSGKDVLIEDDGARITARVAATTDIDPSTFQSGARIQIAGVLVPSTNGFRILPRSTDDIEILSPPIAETTQSAAETVSPAVAQSRGAATWLMGATLLILAGLAVRHYLPALKHYYDKNYPVRLAPQERG